ncbi:MAG TPA: Hpt domain-containing protein [Bacteroidia bacterium]|jgi:HPt (histidine-containing phosphotransfer) domain-containing protein|nr:Hpt domain-containing protein [Bacteroidota bacterium]MBP9789914.1 Hpt domain-containing protein [Bacteroidia bacterium]MBK7432042.1 Hpt domain-containing protein [Bacteroidota bacterium]MBK7570922.1 Hpt domain-containing protein [Bacteroidota bacterium]MBK8585608.1 Hpt domain-containing protein [Bacteroidota bacterium]
MERTTDMTFLKSFTGGNPDKMKKYISMFLSYCPGQIQTMKDQLEAQNYDGLRGTAHALKPQITYMGIKGGEDLIKGIENLAGTKSNVEKLPEMLGNFQTICTSAMEELKQEIA